eukprot:2761737-Rhodomonas_salina.1
MGVSGLETSRLRVEGRGVLSDDRLPVVLLSGPWSLLNWASGDKIHCGCVKRDSALALARVPVFPGLAVARSGGAGTSCRAWHQWGTVRRRGRRRQALGQSGSVGLQHDVEAVAIQTESRRQGTVCMGESTRVSDSDGLSGQVCSQAVIATDR